MIYFIKILYSFLLPPGIFFVLLFALAVRLYWCDKRSALLAAVITFAFYAMSTSYVGHMLVNSLEYRYEVPAKIEGDVIIMLGGGATKDTPDLNGLGGLSGSAANRLMTAFRLYQRLDIPIIVSGGTVFADTAKEAEIAHRLLRDMGVPENKIILEDRSRNTTENALYTKELLQRKGYRQPILVTSAFHMERSLLNFRKQGVNVLALPCDYQNSREASFYANRFTPSADGLYGSALALKEYLGLLALSIGL